MCGETDIAAADIRISMNQMKKNVTGNTVTGFEKQFQVVIMKISTLFYNDLFFPATLSPDIGVCELRNQGLIHGG